MRMARHIVVLCLTLVLLYVGTALGGTNLNALEQEVKETTNYIEQEIISLDDDLEQKERSSLKSIDDMDPSERFFFTSNALNFGNNGATSVTIGNAGYVVLGAYILVPLIIGLALLFYLIGGHGDRGGYSEPYGSTGTTYGHDSYSRSFDPYAIDWEKFSILDWISIGEEAWRKFDPADLDCQKRLICEIHQNTSRFGVAASKMVDLFSYLQYAEVLSLPDEFKALVEEYLDAADRGRSIQKDCGEIYNSCEFSVKSMVDKFSHNEI